MHSPQKDGACRTVMDFVRAGVLRPVQPATSSGWTKYGKGRQFLDAATSGNDVGVDSVLNFTTMFTSDGTIAMRFVPTWASTETVLRRMIYTYEATNTTQRIFFYKKNGANEMIFGYQDGSGSTASSNVATYAANSTNHLVFRFASGASGFIKSDINGTAVSTNHTRTADALGLLKFGNGSGECDAWMGPMLVSPTVKADAWVTAIQASSGAAYSSITRLVRDFMAVGDFIIPLVDNSTAYKRVR